MFGPNISTTEGETWKMHRRIVQQAFTDKNLQLVWSETGLLLDKILEQWDEQQGQEVRIPHVQDMTKELGLAVFSAAALGRRMTLDHTSSEKKPLGYVHSFPQALSIVSGGIINRLLLPSWAEDLTLAGQNLASGFIEFKKYLSTMVRLYQNHGKLDRNLLGSEDSPMAGSESLFMNILVTAGEESKAPQNMDFKQQDILGNTFLLLFAGHETTANGIAFSLGLLAAHPEVQERVYAQVKQVTSSRAKLEYADMNDLKLVTGVMLEALRMYPALLQLSRNADEDFAINVASNAPGAGEETREAMVIPANSKVVIAIAAVHYNPTYWPEPEEFKPERFCTSYNKDAFLGFSTGRKSCIGRRFAETEGTAVLAAILARYQVAIDDTQFPTIPGESIQARRARLLKPSHVLSVAPERLPLVFKRR
ncbi:cytochrome P450 family protein [Ceratobasidium sp. AG-Ba]|nr:cytochrome P450 family protein [Ceratobasidium sp. AG-Ba]QRW11366.1 cytochrome P450 family protein [Ceratobasidium sp. AG-Ba]